MGRLPRDLSAFLGRVESVDVFVGVTDYSRVLRWGEPKNGALWEMGGSGSIF